MTKQTIFPGSYETNLSKIKDKKDESAKKKAIAKKTLRILEKKVGLQKTLELLIKASKEDINELQDYDDNGNPIYGKLVDSRKVAKSLDEIDDSLFSELLDFSGTKSPRCNVITNAVLSAVDQQAHKDWFNTYGVDLDAIQTKALKLSFREEFGIGTKLLPLRRLDEKWGSLENANAFQQAKEAVLARLSGK